MQMTRRELLKASAAFGAFNIIPSKVLWGAEAPSVPQVPGTFVSQASFTSTCLIHG